MQVLDALYLSKQTFSKIRQNLCWAFAYNLISLPLAAGAFLPAFGLALTPSISGTPTSPLEADSKNFLFCWASVQPVRKSSLVCLCPVATRVKDSTRKPVMLVLQELSWAAAPWQ